MLSRILSESFAGKGTTKSLVTYVKGKFGGVFVVVIIDVVSNSNT